MWDLKSDRDIAGPGSDTSATSEELLEWTEGTEVTTGEALLLPW